jgi:hypothetical protein
MITTEKAKELCVKKHITDIEIISVLQKYIFDRKGVSIDINRPRSVISCQLMDLMFTDCVNFYLK